jgi:hypothetical protein
VTIESPEGMTLLGARSGDAITIRMRNGRQRPEGAELRGWYFTVIGYGGMPQLPIAVGSSESTA